MGIVSAVREACQTMQPNDPPMKKIAMLAPRKAPDRYRKGLGGGVEGGGGGEIDLRVGVLGTISMC